MPSLWGRLSTPDNQAAFAGRSCFVVAVPWFLESHVVAPVCFDRRFCVQASVASRPSVTHASARPHDPGER